MPLIDPSDPNLEKPEIDRGSRSSRRLPWFWLGALTGSTVGAIGLGLAIWGWLYIHKDLAPLISTILTNFLERPVQLGEVEQVGLGSVRVGPSTVGASALDSTTLNAQSVIVKFDLIETLLTFELGLDLIVVDADGYLAQDPERGWLNYVFPEQEPRPESRFKVRLDEVYLEDSQLTLVPLPVPGEAPEPILLENVKGQLALDEVTMAEKDAFAVRFEVEGDPVKGGTIGLKGEVQPMVAPVVIKTDGTELAFATNLVVQADEAPLSDVLSFTLSTLELQTNEIGINSGDVSGILDLNFRPEEEIEYSGALSVEEGELTTSILPLPVKKIKGQTQFKDNVWTVDRLTADYGLIDAIAKGLIDFNEGYYDLAAETKDVTVAEFVETIDLALPVPASGVFEAIARVDGPLDKPVFTGLATATTDVKVDEVVFDSASTGFQLQGQNLYLGDILATPKVGGSLQGTGQVLLGEGSPFSFQFAGRDLPANAIASLYGAETNFQIGRVSTDTTVVGRDGLVNTTVEWDAPNAEYAGTGTIDIQGTDLVFRDTVFQVGGGTASGSGTLVDGIFASDVTLAGVQLSSFSPELRGDVGGQFALSGSTANLGLDALRAQGNIVFSQGLASFSPQFDGFSAPLLAQVAWNGEKIQVIEANSDRATASGTLTPSFDNGFSLDQLNLRVTARDYAIADLPFKLPSILAVTGRTDFIGTITGSPTNPTVNGSVNLTNLVVNSLPFESTLTGSVAYASASGVALNVAGGGESILVNTGPLLNQDSLPSFDFAVAWNGATASGQTQGDILTLTAQDFPLATLNFPTDGVANIGQLRGTLSTNQLAVNLVNQSLEGDIQIDRLGLGYISGGQLTGQIRYADSLATLTDGQVVLNKGDNNPDNNTTYSLSGQLSLDGPEPVYSATVTTQQGNVNSLLSAVSIYRLSDFSRGLSAPDWLSDPVSEADLDRLLDTVSVDDSTTDKPFQLSDRLNRLAEIEELQAEAAIAAEANPLPPLSELEGPFAGTFQLDGTGSEFELGFDLAGENWQWGNDYSAQEVVATGSLTPNVLVLQPVRFSSVVSDTEIAANPEAFGTDSEAAVNLVGQIVFGQDTELTSDLQANIKNVDAGVLDNIFTLPFDLEGLANATATLGGTLSNPQLRGNALLSAAAINSKPLQTATATFVYQNAVLSLQSALTASTPEQPLTLVGQIPYAFDFMTVEPATDQINIDINVENEGLALLNILSDQVAFESGTGQVNLTVDGTLEKPVIKGSAALSEAIISAKILPEPLTNVTGNAVFLGDRIVVNTLQGRIGDGNVVATGGLPLRENGGGPAPVLGQVPAASSSPLSVSLESIDLAIADIYEGGVDGQLLVGGSLASGTEIGGQVLLSDGRIRLPDGNTSESEEGSDNQADAEFQLPTQRPIPRTPRTANFISDSASPTFRNLQLTLGDSIQITQGTLLNFVADGTLLLDGAPTALSPQGTINLRRGRVNLFTTLFRLNGDGNTATFTPETGLQNPLLDVSLRAAVSEVNRATPIASTPFARSEIADDTNYGFESTGSLQTIRVRADVEGPANRIFENLELSSTPPRSQSELLGLIGSGVVTALESTIGSLSGSGDSFSGLINLVGGALLNNVQDFVGSALNLSEFRLFPVTAASRTGAAEDRGTGLDIGAEAGFDVTDNVSLSVTKILTDSTNPEFGVNYRLSDSFTVRSNTNLDDINQVFLEYRIRF
ncbi:MAG: translocation/assembly module TamB domain-containing protein [Phormidesmis sp.]